MDVERSVLTAINEDVIENNVYVRYLLIDFFQYNVFQAITVTHYCKPGVFPVFHCAGTRPLPLSCYKEKLKNLSHLNCGLQIRQT